MKTPFAAAVLALLVALATVPGLVLLVLIVYAMASRLGH